MQPAKCWESAYLTSLEVHIVPETDYKKTSKDKIKRMRPRVSVKGEYFEGLK